MVRHPSSTLPRYLFAVCAFLGGLALVTTAIGAVTDDPSGGTSGTSGELYGPSFVPDAKFQGSALAGWHMLGRAEWRAENGELIGKGSPGSGWLVLDHSYQDTGFYAGFRCVGVCDTGVLIRATKTEGGMQGTYLSIKGSQLEAESLTLDDQGNIVARKKLRSAGGAVRFAPSPPDPIVLPSPPPVQNNEPAPGLNLSFKYPDSNLRKEEWNEVEILLDADIMRAYLNNAPVRNQMSVATDEDDMDSYGPIALFIAKGSEVRFKDVSYKDIAIRKQPLEEVGSGFRMQRVSPFYYNWTAAAADFNHDGKLDLVCGGYIFYGPEFTTSREMYATRTFNPSTEYSIWVQHAYDFTGDGWADVVATYLNLGAVLYVNPGNESRRWKQYKILPSMQSEDSLLEDVDGDGKPELIYIADGYMRYAKPDPANPTAPWVVHTISEKGPWQAHGIGVGDINGDGRLDIVGADGWWEQPPQGSGHQLWKYHPEAFGRWGRIVPGGATIGVYDVNGDGLNDVVTGLEAHGFGLAWFEQKRATNGEISFVRHMVMDNYHTQTAGSVTFSELHGAGVADVDGDGVPDFIVGKRQFSHLDDLFDADAYGPPVLYWYKTVRDPSAPGGAKLVPHLIHNSSGAGDNVLPIDLNGDGIMDIVTATKRGLYIFWGAPDLTSKSHSTR
jgi:Domain of Unknown Function (DUF1080)/FG-GAP-like repeat